MALDTALDTPALGTLAPPLETGTRDRSGTAPALGTLALPPEAVAPTLESLVLPARTAAQAGPLTEEDLVIIRGWAAARDHYLIE